MTYRIAGHESFPFRYSWLPKAVRCLLTDPSALSDDEKAMVTLGVGKNMVRSIRFWIQSTGIAVSVGRGKAFELTEFGRALLGPNGLDPFFEDVRTLWLLHWKLASSGEPLLAWDYLLNRFQEPEFVPSSAIATLEAEARKYHDRVSTATIGQHFQTFLHTYVPTRGRKNDVQEDNLDCPLVELALIANVGERAGDGASGRRESLYAFNRDEKPDITTDVFVYCLNEFWQRYPSERTLSLREIAHGHGSPGQVFKLPEDDVRTRLQGLLSATNGVFTFNESATHQHVSRDTASTDSLALLAEVYGVGVRYAR